MELRFVETQADTVVPVGDDCCTVPLFHGTRMYALQSPGEERKRFYTACDKVISFAKKLLWDCPIDEDALMEYQGTKNSLFLGSVVGQYKTPSYAYGSFYVTTSYPTAITFADKAGGELGQWAYAQCVGLRDFQITLDQETADAVKLIEEEYEKYKASEMVILVYTGVEFEDLQTERGIPFLRYDQDGNLDVENKARQIKRLYTCEVSEKNTRQCACRLVNPGVYTAVIIRQKDFKKNLPVFTRVVDVDRYLRWHDSKCLRDLK